MYKTLVRLGMAMLGVTFMASAQSPAPAPPASVNVQLNTQFLNDLMRSAIIFNGMVQGLNVNRALHDSGVASDGRATNAQHTAAVLGAGAGAGVAVGGMTGGQKGAVIGAIAGEFFAGKRMVDAGRAGWGSLLGNLGGMMGKLLIALIMITVFLMTVPPPPI